MIKRDLTILTVLIVLASCGGEPEKKGFTVNNSSPEETKINKTGLQSDSSGFDTRPNGILLCSDPEHRLIPIYKLNQKETRNRITYYTGSNSFHSSYSGYGSSTGNNWNHNFMPGFEAMYGFNLVNIQYHNTLTKTTIPFFKEPVLIKTIYYPTFSKDTLNGEPVKRNYYMVSAYNEDTNNDGYINTDDLRRFFLFNIDGSFNTTLVPETYSVRSSQYDPANDYMYVFAVMDENQNGHHDDTENAHIFWIDLKNPKNNGRLY